MAKQGVHKKKQAKETTQQANWKRLNVEDQNRYLMSLVDYANDFIGIADVNGNTLFVNKGGLKMLGYRKKECESMKVSDYIDPSEHKRFMQTSLPTAVKEGRWRGEVLWKKKNGETFPASQTIVTHYNTAGKPLYFSTIARDITEQEQLEQRLKDSERTYRLLYETMVQGAIYQDARGKVIDANPAAERILGFTVKEMKEVTAGKRPWHITDKDGAKMPLEEAPPFQALRTGKAVHGVIIRVYHPKQKKWRWINGSSIPLFKPNSKEIYQVYSTFDDITDLKEAQRKLAKSERTYRLLYETMAQGVVYQGPDGAITDANPAAERILGLSVAQMQGRKSVDPRWKAIHEDGSDFPGEEHPSMRALQTGKEVRDVIMGVYHPKAKEHRWINVNAIPLFLPNSKEVYQVYSTFDDITDLKNAEDKLTERAQRFEAVISSMGEGLVVVDQELKVLIMNSRAAELLAVEREDAVRQSVYQVFKVMHHNKKLPAKKAPMAQTLATGKPIYGTATDSYEFVGANNTRFPVIFCTTPLQDHGTIGAVIVFRDITHEKEVDRAKTEFVSLASHQLRTPLSTVNWYAEYLMSGSAGEITDEQKDFLQEIYTGNQRMVALVNALLNVSRLELGTFMVAPEDVDFQAVIDQSLKDLQPKIDEKGLRIQKKISRAARTYHGDPKLLGIVVQNLLSNAVKYTPHKGSVSVSVQKDKNKDVILEVSDTGMGIPANQQHQIFEKLFRADNVRQSDTEGTGLGLYMVKSIMDATGGSVSFVSEQGKGTTFTVSLPKDGMKKKEGTKELNS